MKKESGKLSAACPLYLLETKVQTDLVESENERKQTHTSELVIYIVIH
jgi:hypothetical protein